MKPFKKPVDESDYYYKEAGADLEDGGLECAEIVMKSDAEAQFQHLGKPKHRQNGGLPNAESNLSDDINDKEFVMI